MVLLHRIYCLCRNPHLLCIQRHQPVCSKRLKPLEGYHSTSLSGILLTQNLRHTRMLSQIDLRKSRKKQWMPAGWDTNSSWDCVCCSVKVWHFKLILPLHVFLSTPLSRNIMVECWWYLTFVSISRPAGSSWWVCNQVFLIWQPIKHPPGYSCF